VLPNPYIILTALSVWIGSMVAVGAWQHHQGSVGSELACTQATVQAQARVKLLEEQARKIESDHAAAMATVSDQYQKELSNVEASNRRTVSDLNAGLIRLRDNAAMPGRDCPAPGTAATPGSSHGAAPGADLSVPASAFLLTLTARADSLASQLRACQAVVKQDRQ
jgi:hypothetical protein